MLLRLQRPAAAAEALCRSPRCWFTWHDRHHDAEPANEPRAKHTHLAALLDDGRELRYIESAAIRRLRAGR